MNAMHPVHRIASFATVPAIVGAVSGCNRHGTDNGPGIPEPFPAATTAPPPNASIAPAGGAATTTDNSAPSNTTGTDAARRWTTRHAAPRLAT